MASILIRVDAQDATDVQLPANNGMMSLQAPASGCAYTSGRKAVFQRLDFIFWPFLAITVKTRFV